MKLEDQRGKREGPGRERQECKMGRGWVEGGEVQEGVEGAGRDWRGKTK